ncbi:MAG: crossover junction endodeoxyribonuclease RuvC [Actinomycetota bacterium]
MRVLGIDPGLTLGYGVVEREGGRLRAVALGVVRTGPDRPAAERLAALRRGIAEVLDAHRPDAVAVEKVFFSRNVRTAMTVGQASGVALATAAEFGVDVASYTPTEVKQSVVGFGAATKRQVGVMVAALLGLAAPPRPADAADAAALAICHLNRSGLARSIREAL